MQKKEYIVDLSFFAPRLLQKMRFVPNLLELNMMCGLIDDPKRMFKTLEFNALSELCPQLFSNLLFRVGSCTSELQLKVNCTRKVNCRKKFGLILVGQAIPNFFLQFTFRQQFTFSCNSLVHDPAQYVALFLSCENFLMVIFTSC